MFTNSLVSELDSLIPKGHKSSLGYISCNSVSFSVSLNKKFRWEIAKTFKLSCPIKNKPSFNLQIETQEDPFSIVSGGGDKKIILLFVIRLFCKNFITL